MSDRIIEGSTKFLCAAIELAMGRIDLCKCSECGGPRDNGWACDECGEGYCDPITEDCHTEVAISAINSHDKLTSQVKELRAALEAIKQHQEIMAGGNEMILSKLSAYAVASKALKESEV
tara:strand:- start:1453 stop:1812 length:360 start_codon:yes stop_codon:yes gene_type:complete